MKGQFILSWYPKTALSTATIPQNSSAWLSWLCAAFTDGTSRILKNQMPLGSSKQGVPGLPSEVYDLGCSELIDKNNNFTFNQSFISLSRFKYRKYTKDSIKSAQTPLPWTSTLYMYMLPYVYILACYPMHTRTRMPHIYAYAHKREPFIKHNFPLQTWTVTMILGEF